jgi:phospholipid/cholesterol/gamma-HCH transport system substrate-binding protein
VHAGHRDDVTYRIRFAESVSGMAEGDPVKFQGVDIGTVKSMAIDPDDPRLVRVEVRLRKDAPVKTDTKASLKLKGITGVVFVELAGGSAEAKTLLAATPAGTIPEIPSEKSSIADILDQLPKVIRKLSALESKAGKVMSDVGEAAGQIKESPLLNLGRRKKDKAPEDK